MLRRDFDADWHRWTMLERLGAIVVLGALIATPVVLALTSLIR
jgi:hypothetical protein